jgi:hypothetical protein
MIVACCSLLLKPTAMCLGFGQSDHLGLPHGLSLTAAGFTSFKGSPASTKYKVEASKVFLSIPILAPIREAFFQLELRDRNV